MTKGQRASTKYPNNSRNEEQERRSCPAFDRTWNNYKKPNHFATECRMKKATIHFVGEGFVAVGEGNIDESNATISDYSLFWHTGFIQDGAMEKIKVNGKELPM